MSRFDSEMDAYIDNCLEPLNVFCLQFLFFTYKTQLSLNYFLDYPMTTSYNELIVKREEIKKQTY